MYPSEEETGQESLIEGQICAQNCGSSRKSEGSKFRGTDGSKQG
jgi:hypothetical protein